MDYIIKNNKNAYIRLDKNGAPITCTENDKKIFEYSKAMNILNGLPKTLKRLKFKVEPVSEITPQVNKDVVTSLKKVIKNNNYELSEKVSRWIDKFGTCYDVLQDAENTYKELLTELEKTDNSN